MNKPYTFYELHENISREIMAVTAKIQAATFRNMQRRIQLCLEAQEKRFAAPCDNTIS